jgi:hypothetical protein
MLAYCAGSFAAFVIGPRYSLLLTLSIAVSAITLLITFSLPAIGSKVEVEIKPQILFGALKAIRDSPQLRRILFGAVIIQGLLGMLGEYLPAYYQQVGTPTQLVALLMSAGSATAVLLYWWMNHFEAQISKYQLPIVLGSTTLFLISFAGNVAAAVIGFFLLTRILRVIAVNNETLIQHHAHDKYRATLGSVYSFVGKVLSAALLMLIGFFAVNGKIITPLRWSVISFVLILTSGSVYFWLSRKNLVAENEQR